VFVWSVLPLCDCACQLFTAWVVVQTSVQAHCTPGTADVPAHPRHLCGRSAPHVFYSALSCLAIQNPTQYTLCLAGVSHVSHSIVSWLQVRAFLKAPAKSMKGLPRRPVVGTAISIRLDLDKAQISEWFGAGYD
jgi:hypothetical protein